MVRRVLTFAAAWLLVTVAPLVAAQVFGPLQAQNNLSEIAANGTQSTAQSNLGLPALLASPSAIGSTAPNSGAFTTLSANSTVSGTGFSTYLASPPAIGGTSAAAGSFTTLTASSTVTLGSKTIALNASGTFFPGHGLVGVQTFCATGCTATGGTYTADTGTNQVIVEVQAPGGGSGGCAATGASQACTSSGGAGGSFGSALITSAFNSVTVTIGAVGTAGTAGSNAGGTGGTTSFGALISCPGGTGGGGGAATTPGSQFQISASLATPPSACTFSGATKLFSIPGQSGMVGLTGGSVGSTQVSGGGGSSARGIGAPGINTGSTGTGNSGSGYGSGPSGSVAIASQSAVAGVAGSPGIVIVYEYN